MGDIDTIEQLRREIGLRIGDATTSVDAPTANGGSWWVDVRQAGHTATVEYRPNEGFGVSGPRGGYGEGPDVVLPNVTAAADQVVAFLVAARLVGDDDVAWRQRDLAASIAQEVQRGLDERFAALRKELADSIAIVSGEVKNLESEVHQLVAAGEGHEQERA
jgi:hypothetical protein